MRELRRTLELCHYKWDAQIGDLSVLYARPLLISATRWAELATHAQRLFEETLEAERALMLRPALYREIGLPWQLCRLFARGRPTPAAARVMRFDFHWTRDGWRVSEVNSDVPGGYSEATHLTRLMAEHVPNARSAGDPTSAFVQALEKSTGNGSVALTSAPGHMEDHQVVDYLAAALRARGCGAQVVSLQQLRWSRGHARIEIAGKSSVPVDAVVRFYQVEWLARLSRTIGWEALFVDAHTQVTNPGTAALSESKRLPLVWDRLDIDLSTWASLLPETRALRDAPWQRDEGWLIKPAYGNTGDFVSIRANLTAGEWAQRAWRARLRPSNWLAQRRFISVPLFDEQGPLYPCVGVYVVSGIAHGAYARVTRGPIIDFKAQDTALLIDSAV